MTILDYAHDINFLALAVLALAAYRITRIIVLDEVLGAYPDEEHPRGTGLRKLADLFFYDAQGEERGPVRGWLSRLVTCSWCAGVWVSVALTCLWFLAWPWQLGVQGWLFAAAVCGGQGFIASRHNA